MTTRSRIVILQIIAIATISGSSYGITKALRWRTATQQELKKLIPARAPVIKENIETEFRTASGVFDGQGKYIAGVVMITAGYSAEGKYSHFFITQVPLQLGDLGLQPGEYVFGYQRTGNDSIRVSFYKASTGDSAGDVEAHINRKRNLVTSLLITPPVGGKGTIQVGRFIWDYRVSDWDSPDFHPFKDLKRPSTDLKNLSF